MASDILHIKDSFYFEVPKALWPSRREEVSEFPEVWIRLDPQYQLWEAQRIYVGLNEEAGDRSLSLPPWKDVAATYLDWKEHDHEHFAVPFSRYLELRQTEINEAFHEWQKDPKNAPRSLNDFIDATHPETGWFAKMAHGDDWAGTWSAIQESARNVREFARDESWNENTLEAYNHHLSGKILIPQPFGKLRNLYEAESGVCVSKFMIVQVVVALILVGVFSWLGRRIATGDRPRGRLWNMLEAVLLYFRDRVVRPALASHHEEHDNDHHEVHDRELEPHLPLSLDQSDESRGSQAVAEAVRHHDEFADADRFLPFLWTLFIFILGCNLMGMVPWVGAPTGSFGVTTGLALATLALGLWYGIGRFGPGGYLLHFIPSLGDLPQGDSLGAVLFRGFLGTLFVIIKALLLVVELVGLLIKHGVLAVRLLANMVAGHLVLAAIMGLAFGATAAVTFADAPTWQWGITATIAVFGSLAFNLLELFVAFLQAYVFTFLAALFIASSVHEH